MNRWNALRLVAFALVATIYIAVRFWNLTAACLWFDEIFSVHAAEHSWNSILDFVALDLIHPPLFYLILKVWIAVGGESLVWMRSLPVVFSVVAIVPFLLLCREIKLSYWTSLLAFLLIAVNGSLIKYAQEVRMYSMLMWLSLFSIWLFVRYIRAGKGIAALTIVNILLVYTHYFGWFVLLVEAIVLAYTAYARSSSIFNKRQRSLTTIAVVAGVPFVCFIPWLLAVISAAASGSEVGQNIGWMLRPGLSEIVHLALSIVEPFYYATTSIDARSWYLISVPLLLIAVAALVVYVVRSDKVDAEQRSSMILLAAFCAVPSALVLVGSWFLPYSIWGTRHLTIVFVPASILIANAVAHLPNLRTFVSTTLILFVGYAFLIQARRPVVQPIWCGFEPIGDKLQAQLNGPIYVFEDLAAYHLWFRFRNYPDAKFRQRVVKVDGFPGMPEDKAYFIPRGLDDEFLRRGYLPLTIGKFWIVYRESSFDFTKPPVDTLTANGLKVTQRDAYDGGESKIYAIYVVREDDKAN